MEFGSCRSTWMWSLLMLVVVAGCCCYWCEGCLDSEKKALLKLKDDINYPNGNSLSSWKGGDCCNWKGVICNNSTSRVYELDLIGARDERWGTWYPNATLFAQFKELSSLYLQFNMIGGWNMPLELCRLRNLKSLDLSYNNLDDDHLPSCLGNMSKLTNLGLSGNNLRGQFLISTGIGQLSNLMDLDISQNKFNESDASLFELCRLRNLQSLSLSYNNLDDDHLPSCLGNMSKLTILDFSGNNLRGQFLISTELCRLRNLQSLDLSYNNLDDDHLPSCLGNMSKLTNLGLTENNLRGQFLISTELCRLRNLQSLSLSYNNLDDDQLPSCLGNMSKLTSLYLSGNNLRGKFLISTDLFKLRALQSLYLQNNALEGSIPPSISNMHSLRSLGLSHNQLSGNVPPLGNLSSLTDIRLANNKLDGMFEFSTFSNLSELTTVDLSNNPLSWVKTESPTWIPSFQLRYLYLSNCGLDKHSGNAILSILATQSNLEILDLSESNLAGNIPSWLLYNLTKLRTLKLDGNSLVGSLPLPSGHDANSSIAYLDISQNRLWGPFPSTINMLLPELRYLNMSNNDIKGELSFHNSKASYLEVLDLSSNKFSGQIPNELLSNFASLRYLSLSDNQLHGDLPSLQRSNMTSLEHLLLDRNKFTGAISHVLSNGSLLQTFDVRQNFLNGKIPSWLPSLPNLASLLLGGNDFVGSIPMELCQMQNLRLLDLSNNSLSGNIPSCINNISSWSNATADAGSYYISASDYAVMLRNDFTTKGTSLSYEGIPLSLMTGIDFSSNQLTGNIPGELGYLEGLRSLNLSHNLLMGALPESFQYLKNIESLDLSYNKLTGRIPPQMTQLTFLSTFRVISNNLFGMIPLEGQFSTFNESSYEGNPSLCGKPLGRNCSSPPHVEHGGENAEKLRLIDNPVIYYSFVAISYALGFWSFIGLLFFNKRWQKKFFKTVDRWFELCSEMVAGLT